MNIYSCFRAFCSLLLLVCVSGDITRGDNYFEGEFSNNHKGRMLRVLMVFNNLALDKCVVKCIQHIRCKTVNYNFDKEKCELTDVDFNDDEADKLSYDWYNIGTPSKVDGVWGPWRNVTQCTATCDGGTMNQARDCDSPKPQHGGDDCVGNGERTIGCNTHPCTEVDGKWGAWINGGCTVTCGEGTLTRTRKCESSKCSGLSTDTISCNTKSCPVHGNWGPWKITSMCNEGCEGGYFTKERVCDSPGGYCTGDNNMISLPCTKNECPVKNIAVNKPSKQNGNNGADQRAERGNDGNKRSRSTTRYASNPWWEIDLGDEVQIEYFILRVPSTFQKDVRVLGKTATGIFQTCRDPVHIIEDVVKFSCDSIKRFKYVRIEQKSRGYLYIREFEVYVKKT